MYTRQKELGHDHVRDDLGGPLSWDLGFLGFGVVLVVAWRSQLLGRSIYARMLSLASRTSPNVTMYVSPPVPDNANRDSSRDRRGERSCLEG